MKSPTIEEVLKHSEKVLLKQLKTPDKPIKLLRQPAQKP